MKRLTNMTKILTAAAAFLLICGAVRATEEKNIVRADFRYLPADFENLPYQEAEKWNFGFRPYGAEAAAVLWSDPKVIRSVASGNTQDAKHLATAVYVSCDEYGFNVLGYGATQDGSEAMAKGNGAPDVFFECFFIPGDADDPAIENYQPMGISTTYPYWQYKLSWMKEDRHVRFIFNDVRLSSKYNRNGIVLHIHVPWVLCWDKLPVFRQKKDNFWRLSLIRWGGSHGAETLGGVVHSQTKCGYIRMPDFTPEQQTKIMKTTLLDLWGILQKTKSSAANQPGRTMGLDRYRKSIDSLPHSWMNINEDPVFKKEVLIPMYDRLNGIGKGIAGFEKMTLDEQKAFYLKNAPLIANFQYDLDEAYADFLHAKMMKE